VIGTLSIINGRDTLEMTEQTPREEGKTPSICGTEMSLFKLDLSSKDISEVEESSPLGEIRVLDVSGNKFGGLQFLGSCRDLIELNASENQISEGLESISDLAFLSFLNLSGNLFESLAGFPNRETLVVLDLSKNHLTTVAELPPLPLLRDLNLSNNAICDLQLPVLPSLHNLDLSHNDLSSLVLPELPSLRILDASNNSIESIQEFGEETLPYLWSCDLRENALAVPDSLNSLAKLPLLWYLQLKGNPMADNEGNHVAPVLVILPALTMLDDKLVNAKDKVKASLAVRKEEGGKEEEQIETREEEELEKEIE
jgi:Leucine-rich repeat (LRR) protein